MVLCRSTYSVIFKFVKRQRSFVCKLIWIMLLYTCIHKIKDYDVQVTFTICYFDRNGYCSYADENFPFVNVEQLQQLAILYLCEHFKFCSDFRV